MNASSRNNMFMRSADIAKREFDDAINCMYLSWCDGRTRWWRRWQQQQKQKQQKKPKQQKQQKQQHQRRRRRQSFHVT
jgi:hypothetical protein